MKRIIFFPIFVLLLTACSLPTPTPAVTSTPAATLTATPQPLYQQVTVDFLLIKEDNAAPRYLIQADVPVLKGSDDPRVQAFNAAAASLVQKEIDAFKTNVSVLPAEPISVGSTFDMIFTVVSPQGNLISLLYKVDVYSDGAAHPFTYSVTYTYDLERGEQVTLDRLFLPGSDYLGPIATWCRDELSRRDIGFLEYGTEGADPLAENYRNWNITAAGLLISFDPYQVAPYAAGPQTVTIPYEALKDVIDPDGPLGSPK